MDYDNDEIIIDTSLITGRFIVIKDEQYVEFSRYDDIPETFDHLVTFLPSMEGHDYEWLDIISELQPELAKRETR